MNIQKTLCLLFFFYFTLNVFSQISFKEKIITDDTFNASVATDVMSVDVDNDGDMDVIAASAGDHKIAWYENINGEGIFGQLQIITTNAENALSVYSCDLDDDGDMDVLSASSDDNKIAWYENMDGLGDFSSQKTITTNADIAYSVYASDIDGDGDIDVLSASRGDNKIAWYENTNGSGVFSTEKIITTNADGATSVFAIDIDGDGDQDVLSSSIYDDRIAWYENTNGNGNFGPQQTITTFAERASSVYATDIDNDGDMDVLSASYEDHKIAWYENMDGLGSFGSQQIITTVADNARNVYTSDIDGDGDVDILSASSGDDKIAWYENTNGSGMFSTEKIITTNANGAYSVFTIDLDGDGDMDVLSASFNDNKIAWYENNDGNGNFGNQQLISSIILAEAAHSVYSCDIDNDGDMDVLSASILDNKIAWYENTDGLGTFGTQQTITTSADLAQSVFAIDIDSDGDMDVISASKADNKIAWYENTDGLGTFGSQQTISTSANSARSVYAGDIDGDGDIDVLSASSGDDKIAWYENIDGLGSFGPQQIITTSANGPQSVHSCDIDGDGDIDVLSASILDDEIAWYENIDGFGAFGPQQIITTNAEAAFSVYASDIDGDGDLDVLSASFNDSKIAWYENMDGLGAFGPQQIISAIALSAYSVYASDIDSDGDMDVLSASFEDNKIAWYENTDGLGTFSDEQFVSKDASGASCVYATDIDGDGDMDVLSASNDDHKIAWYKNLGNVNIEENLMLYYPFTGDTNDITGNGFHGEGNATLTMDRFGNPYEAYSFNGIDQYIDLPNVSELKPNLPVSFSFWVNLADLQPENSTFFTTDFAQDNHSGVWMSLSATQTLSISFGDASGNTTSSNRRTKIGTTPLSTNVWYHIVGVVSGQTDMEIYIDCINDNGTYSGTGGNLSYTSNPGSIGRKDANTTTNAYYFMGVMDDFRYWNRELSIGEIEYLCNSLSSNEEIDTETNSISIYPNPTTGILKVISDLEIVKIEVYDKLGQLIISKLHDNEIDITDLAQEIYFLRILNEKGAIHNKRIIKK